MFLETCPFWLSVFSGFVLKRFIKSHKVEYAYKKKEAEAYQRLAETAEICDNSGS